MSQQPRNRPVSATKSEAINFIEQLCIGWHQPRSALRSFRLLIAITTNHFTAVEGLTEQKHLTHGIEAVYR
jgi:hypothetical protein